MAAPATGATPPTDQRPKAFPLPSTYNEAHYVENVKKVIKLQSVARRKPIRQHYQLLGMMIMQIKF